MKNRFEELEEQLEQLETIPLVSAGVQGTAAASQELAAATAPRTIPKAIGNVNAEAAQQALLRDEHKSVEPEPTQPTNSNGFLTRLVSTLFGFTRWKSSSRLQALEDQALAECQERMREVVGGVIKDARKQLEVLTDELVPTLQTRLEKSTENSVEALSSQFAKQLEQQVQAATRRTLAITPPLQSREPAETMGERRNDPASAEVERLANGESIQAQLAQAFAPVVQEIQVRSAAFLDHLNLQLHNTLRAFGEKATKHAAEEFSRIAVEVLKAEARRLQTPQNACRMPAGTIGSAPPTPSNQVDKPDLKRQARSAWQAGPHESTPAAQARSGSSEIKSQSGGAKPGGTQKVRSDTPKWRILGLG
jgi:hypothetical protein